MAKTDAEIIAAARKLEKDSELSVAMQKSLDDKATQAELDALTAHIAGCTPAAED
jgi:hypothetical protein